MIYVYSIACTSHYQKLTRKSFSKSTAVKYNKALGLISAFQDQKLNQSLVG